MAHQKYFFPLLNKNDNSLNNGFYKTLNNIERSKKAHFLGYGNINKRASEIYALSPESIICIRYGYILSQEIIDITRNGVFNIHSGILPNYRGILASFWSILYNAKHLGLTLHKIIDHTIDTGPILHTTKIVIHPKNSLLKQIIDMYELCIPKIWPVLYKGLIKKSVKLKTQNQDQANYYSYPVDQEVIKFLAKGYKLIDTEDYLKILERFV